MTYYMILNNTIWDTTRNAGDAFRWFNDWSARGFNAGLKFLRDDDKENAAWMFASLKIDKEEKIAA